jgi:dolichol-phosphate mannosyltransferase
MISDAGQTTVDWAATLKGPIVVLGAGGFVGANLFNRLLASRSDVYAVVRRLPAWRLADVDERHLLEVDLIKLNEVRTLIETIQPATIFNCTAYGAYSFETKPDLIYETNLKSMVTLIELLRERPLAAFVHAGSSSEYGANCAGPVEDSPPLPNSHYAVSKVAVSNLISYAGKTLGMPVVNLRLYSVYGPYEDSSRLIPNLVKCGLDKKYPPFVDPDTSRDFVYVDDVSEAFLVAAAKLTPDLYGESFNIGSGEKTTIRQLANTAQDVFAIPEPAEFGSMTGRSWDLNDWYSNSEKAHKLLGWKAKTGLAEGLGKMADWIRKIGIEELDRLTKRTRPPVRRSITAIIACYKDGLAIPIMYERLVSVFRQIGVDYEIIFVNDCSPDNSAAVIKELSERDENVLGISHSRNFGSQMAFRSGMEMATKDACVLLDGDLQDPPEVIAEFYHKWCEGNDIVYGRRVKREMSLVWGLLYKAFYRVFAAFSYIKIPHDAGDFSLIDRRAVGWLLQCPERDLFMRGLRAYIGFKQVGVDYFRPERMFGKSTNNIWKNIAWAKRGIFSFSNTPLTILTATGIGLIALSFTAGIILTVVRLLAPDIVPRGITTILLSILFFGAVNLFGIGLVGEYVAKIMEEVKGRPRLIRSALIRNGEVSELFPNS